VDLVLEGFRPGVLERLGLGWEALQRVNPRVVLVSISGWGSPEGETAGHDLTYLARTGLLSLAGEVPFLPIADLSGGMLAAAGGLAALLQARISGRGSHVEASLFDSAQAMGAIYLAEALSGQPPTRETMALGGEAPCYALYETAEGQRVALGALEPKFWAAFCQAVERPDWKSRAFDPALKPELQRLFATQPLSYWSRIGQQVDCCLEPVRSLNEAADAIGSASRLQPLRFDGGRPAASGPAPHQGAETTSVLRSLGVTVEAVAHLQREGIIPT
jgi:crotonobetainyl-CoA:carnitine CoA-transferase CaiB-like acyl-CoA transferase